MFWSNASMNSGTFTSVSAAVMEPTRAITSEAESAYSGESAKHATRMALSPIAGIDLNVFFRKVAGPKAGCARASPMQDDSDAALGFIQFFLEFGLREIGGQAGAADRDVLQIDIHL